MFENVIHKRSCLYAYKFQQKHDIKPDDQPRCYNFATLMLNRTSPDTDSHLEVKLMGLRKSDGQTCA
jgi:hypothetical protein